MGNEQIYGILRLLKEIEYFVLFLNILARRSYPLVGLLGYLSKKECSDLIVGF